MCPPDERAQGILTACARNGPLPGRGVAQARIEPRAPAAVHLNEEIGGAQRPGVFEERGNLRGVVEHPLAPLAEDPQSPGSGGGFGRGCFGGQNGCGSRVAAATGKQGEPQAEDGGQRRFAARRACAGQGRATLSDVEDGNKRGRLGDSAYFPR